MMEQKKDKIGTCWLCGSVCIFRPTLNNLDARFNLNDRLIESMQWMIDTFKWEHEQAGLGGDYSPELKKAVELLETLKEGSVYAEQLKRRNPNASHH